ncbi:GTPase HflX, partial [bacterium]|nr:GTPase HflX [bacterium]
MSLYENKTDERENAVLVGVVQKHQDPWVVEEHMNELELLADTAGANTAARVIQRRTQLNPAHYVGRGKVNEIKELAEECKAGVIIFDDDLSPAQARNLEEICKVKILDRSGVILDIFAKRARTKQAKTQVELAQLNYHLPRLTRQWTHLSRQVGGIGTRGPGETQLEVDRRLVRQRIRVLKKQLVKIEKEQSVRRKGRGEVFNIALIGYTNVGKSTLLNT